MPSPEFGRLSQRVRDKEPYVGSGSLADDDLRRIDCFKQVVSAQCFALVDTIVEQYASRLEAFTYVQNNEKQLRQTQAEAGELRRKSHSLEDELARCKNLILQQQVEIEALRANSFVNDPKISEDFGMLSASPSPTAPLVAKELQASRPLSVKTSPTSASLSSPCRPKTNHGMEAKRVIFFADVSPECDDECALLYMLSDFNNSETPAIIELIVTDCQARFRWMEHIFEDKFGDSGGWTLIDDEAGFVTGCVQVNLYLLHQPQRGDMVTKEIKTKAQYLEIDKPGHLKFSDHTKVASGDADLILMAAPVPELDPAFFSRFTGLQGVYVVGTPGGVNCPQPSWGNILGALHQLAPVIYLSPQFTRTVCFPKDYVEDNPHWTWLMKRTVFDMALTVMARRPEIPAKFGDWGLILRLNAANAKLCKKWYEDVMKVPMENVENCPVSIRSIVQAYVNRNSGEDRKLGAVVQELTLLGVQTRAVLDAKGAPVSPEEAQVLKNEYQQKLFECVYACIMATETLLFQNQANLQTKPGAEHFLTMMPLCGYADAHESLANIFGVEQAINIVQELPISSLTPAYDMVGAICALTFLKDENFDTVGLVLEPADRSISSDLIHSDHTSEHPIWIVGGQSQDCVDSVVHMLRTHVKNDPLLVIHEFWAQWRLHNAAATQESKDAFTSKGITNLSAKKSLADLGDKSAGAIVRDTHCMQQWMLHPVSYWQMMWSLVSMLLVGYDCIMVPLLAFDVEESVHLIISISLFWTVDLVKNFFLGYYHHGVIEMRPGKVVRHYLRTWFCIDAVIVAVDWLSLFEQGYGKNFLALLRISRAFRLGRILQMTKINRFIANLEDSNSNFMIATTTVDYILRVAKMIFCIFAANHFVACLWYFAGRPESHDIQPDTTADGGTGLGWVLQAGMESESFAMLYLTSVHWAFAHLLLGEVDVSPSTPTERALSIFIHSIGLIVFSSFVSSLTELMAHAAEQSAEKSKRDFEVRGYMEDHLVSVRLMSCIENYRRHARRHAQRQKLPRQQIEGLGHLPVSLAVRLSEEVYVRPLLTHGFFKKYNAEWPDHLAAVVHECIEEELVAPDQEIFCVGQTADCVYIIAKGRVQYTKDLQGDVAEEGEWVSEPALWLAYWTRRGDMAAEKRVSSELLALKVDKFRDHVTGSYCTGQFACQFAELVARGVHQNRTPFAMMSDLGLDLADREVLAERALTW